MSPDIIIISMVEDVSSTATRQVSVQGIINAVKRGRWRQTVERIRHVYQETLKKTGSHQEAKKAVDQKKKPLPGVTWSGTFSRRGKEYLLQYSGLFCADIDMDALTGKDLKEVRAKLQTSPYVLAVFRSPTGSGLKVIVRVRPDASQHDGSVRAVRQHILDLTGVQIDESGKDLARLCFVSHDPDAYLNLDACEIEPLPLPEKPVRLQSNAAVNLSDRQRIAVELFGEIGWHSDSHGFATCPGEHLHTTPDAWRDCEIYLDGVSTVHCFHNSCSGIVAGVNHELRSRIAKAEYQAESDGDAKARTVAVESPEELFNKIKAYITRYVVLSQPQHADVLALWVMHTWVADSADFTPYIYLHSPVMRCGKTQVHRVVEPLVKNPLRTCNVSEAALYREIEESHPTLLWDEIDSIFGNRKSSEANQNKRALLNAGYERGMTAIRMERGPGGFVKISFDPFCPKILAGIGRLPDTIVDRSIPILIHRRLKTQSCHKYRRQDRAKAKPLYDALEAWSKDVELLKTLRESQPQMPESLTDRQEDILEPLLAIADSIGGDVPRLARVAAELLCDIEDELSYGAEQLAAIRKVVGNKSRITSAELIKGLWEADALPSRLMDDNEPNHKKIGHWLSKFIKSYAGKPARQLKFEGQNLRGYETAELQPIFDRYCPPQ
jgi:hypothetical protein